MKKDKQYQWNQCKKKSPFKFNQMKKMEEELLSIEITFTKIEIKHSTFCNQSISVTNITNKLSMKSLMKMMKRNYK